MDDVAISPPEGFLIRKGPGNCHFDFAQEILFVDFVQTPTEIKYAEDYPYKYQSELLLLRTIWFIFFTLMYVFFLIQR